MDGRIPFEKIVADHGATVLRVCRAVLGPHEADDAWSETFLSALKAYPALDAGANVEAWLVTIAHRKAIDVTRAGRRTVTLEELPERLVATDPADHSGPDLWRAIGGLPAKQRQAVAYHYLAGLSYRDVAEILGGTTEAARRAAFDGIQSLRTRFSMRSKPTKGNRR